MMNLLSDSSIFSMDERAFSDMNGVVSLTAACLLTSLQCLFMKAYQLRSDNSLRAALRMILFDGIWVIQLFFGINGFRIRITAVSALYGLLFAGFAMACSVCSLFAVRRGKVAVVTLFQFTGGLVLPLAYGVAVLGERLSLLKLAAVLLLFLSFFPGVLLNREQAADDCPQKKTTGSAKSRLSFLALGAAVFVCNGILLVLIKAHSISPHGVPERDFLLFAALIRTAASGAVLAGIRLAGMRSGCAHAPSVQPHRPAPQRLCGRLIPFMIIGAFTLCNASASVLSMLAAKTMPSSVQFPVYCAAVVVVTALLSRIVYKEKLAVGDRVGMLLTIAGIALMLPS